MCVGSFVLSVWVGSKNEGTDEVVLGIPNLLKNNGAEGLNCSCSQVGPRTGIQALVIHEYTW